MTEFPLPVRVVGPGSQPEDAETLEYLPMPREMSTFRMPAVPETADAAALRASRELLGGFLDALSRWDPATDSNGPQCDLARMSPETLTVTNQMLGEGEVSIVVGGDEDIRIQESVFTGLWRVVRFDAGRRVVADWLEAGALPRVVVDAARRAAQPEIVDGSVNADGVMNAPALIAEIRAQKAVRVAGAPAHVINLTLFPMTPQDHAALDAALPVGPVAIISRGFGNCRITSTGVRDVWRVQYFNNMNTLILNTVEIVDVPEVALAAAEDLEDSRERLSELVDWMTASLAE
jgi:hydrogenase-1 operon protein HyaF